jgi:hypothetical protein
MLGSPKTPKGRFIKGSVLVDYVKLMHANPDLPWSEYLSPDDLAQLSQLLLPASWYPIELFDHLGLAVFRLVSKENWEVVKAYGRFLADKMNSESPGLVSRGRPADTLKKYRAILERLYSYPIVEFAEVGPGRARAEFKHQPEDVAVRQLLEVTTATIARLVELSEGREITVQVDYQEGRDANALEITWQE